MTPRETLLKLEELEAAIAAGRIDHENMQQAIMSRVKLTADLHASRPRPDTFADALPLLPSGLPNGTRFSPLDMAEASEADILKDAERYGPDAVANMRAALEGK